MKKILSLIFVAFAVFECVNVAFDLPLRMISKPALMTIMMIYYLSFSTKKHPAILIGLIAALMGDIFLLYPQGFLLGLGSFLIMQLCYIGYFYQQKDRWFKENYLIFVVLFFCFLGAMAYLFPRIEETMKIPVAIYGAVLCCMVFFAAIRRRIVYGYKYVLIGAILFLISDSMIALHTFITPQKIYPVLIMMSYLTAQYLIIEGLIRFEKTQKPI